MRDLYISPPTTPISLMLCTGIRIFIITGEEQGRTREQQKDDLDVNVYSEQDDTHFQNCSMPSFTGTSFTCKN